MSVKIRLIALLTVLALSLNSCIEEDYMMNDEQRLVGMWEMKSQDDLNVLIINSNHTFRMRVYDRGNGIFLDEINGTWTYNYGKRTITFYIEQYDSYNDRVYYFKDYGVVNCGFTHMRYYVENENGTYTLLEYPFVKN